MPQHGHRRAAPASPPPSTPSRRLPSTIAGRIWSSQPVSFSLLDGLWGCPYNQGNPLLNPNKNALAIAPHVAPSTRFTLGMEEDQEQGGEPPVQEPTPNAGSIPAGGVGGKKGSPCEECGEQPWKYRCPGCSRLTCSLPCVQSHKRCTACTGKRPCTNPVPLSQFDDNQLLSDYNFLEETKHVRESTHRLIGGFGRNFRGVRGVQLPKWLFFLRKAAQRRGIRLHFLPRGMTRREQNRSRHNYRKDCIY